MKTKKCIVCGNTYEYCSHCPSKFDPTTTWKINFDTENCRTIFSICNDFVFNVITKDEAIEKLSDCDISQVENFNPIIAKNIADICE